MVEIAMVDASPHREENRQLVTIHLETTRLRAIEARAAACALLAALDPDRRLTTAQRLALIEALDREASNDLTLLAQCHPDIWLQASRDDEEELSPIEPRVAALDHDLRQLAIAMRVPIPTAETPAEATADVPETCGACRQEGHTCPMEEGCPCCEETQRCRPRTP